ncbi:MAG: S-layer homology domain-containing protein [Oscillospiraceae bacterium]|nr:S-layer homology domain-containing protein [Oscillospiraceae bacterium]
MNRLKRLLGIALALVVLCTLLPASALAEPDKHAVQIGTILNGTVVSDKETAAEGEQVTLTIVPRDGYRFVEDSLRVTAGGQTVPADISSAGGDYYRADFTMPDSAVSVSAEFSVIKYRVVFADSLFTNGKVKVKVGNGSEVALGSASPFVEAAKGDTVKITSVPNSGYQLTEGRLSSTGASLSGSNGVYTFTMPAGTVNISGSFSPGARLAVASVANAVVRASFGSFTVTEGSNTVVPAGSTVTVSIAPDTGYILDYVRFGYKLDGNDATVELTPNENGVCTFRMPENVDTVTVMAAVKVGNHTVSVTVNTNAVISAKVGSGTYTAIAPPYTFAPKTGETVSLRFDAGSTDLVRSHSVTYTENGETKSLEHTLKYSPVSSNPNRCELTFTMPDSNVSVDIQFGAAKTVIFPAIEHGTLVLESAGLKLCESTAGKATIAGSVAAGGAVVEIHASPENGYAVDPGSVTVTYLTGTAAIAEVFYDKDGGFYWFTMPESSLITAVTVSAEFVRGQTATLKSIPVGGKAEAYVTAEKAAENLLAASSVSADVVSAARLSRNDVVYVYTTPDPGCTVKDIVVSYSLNGTTYQMTTNGTSEANRINLDTSYNSGSTYRFFFTMPAADVTITVTYDAPLFITGVKRTSDSEAEVTFKSDTAGTYYYVCTTYSTQYTSGAALKAASGGQGDAAAAGTGAAPVTNTVKLTDLPNATCYVHIVVADRFGSYTNIARAEIPLISHGVITSGGTSYSLSYDISGTVLTVTGIINDNGEDVTAAVTEQFAATKKTTVMNLSDCGSVTQIRIPYSIIAPFSSEINSSAAAEALEVDFNSNQYGFRFDSDAIAELAAPLDDESSFSYAVLGVQPGTYASLTAAQKTYVDDYAAARVIIPTVAYMNYNDSAPVYISTYPAFSGEARLLAVHAIDPELTPLGVTGYEIAPGGGISQAIYSYTALSGGNGYISFRLRSVPAKLVVGYWTNPFPDIADYAQSSALHWAYEAAKYNEIDGRFKGMADGTFSPMTNMNTAQLITALYRVYYGADPDQTQGDYWYSAAAAWAIGSGIISSDDFVAGADVTREQFVTMFYDTLRLRDDTIAPTAAMKQKLATAVDYSSISASSRDAVAWAVGSGLISGTTSDVLTIDPSGHINRIQVCQMLRNYYTKVLG